jgi:hypothetical protein
MHFGTEETWLDVIRDWARQVPEVEKVWIFGSRATGQRREKDDPGDEPDLDIAYTLRGSDFGSLLGLVIFKKDGWHRWLQGRIAVRVDHQFAAPDDNIVWPSAEEHGLLIYVADD